MAEGSSHETWNAHFQSKAEKCTGHPIAESPSTEGQDILQNNLELPSKVIESNFIRMPSSEYVLYRDDEWSKCGKWMWYNYQNTALLDRVWRELQHLLSDGTLIMIRASTAAMTNGSGVILCYTRPGKEDIRRASKAIRDVTKDDYVMYYKVNEDTISNSVRRHGFKKITKYMYTVKGRLYRRDQLDRWILDEDRPPECRVVCESVRRAMRNSAREHLPSNSDKQVLKHSTSFRRKDSTGSWILMCNNSDRDKSGWTEADRAWIAATLLYEEHTFERIEYQRRAQVAYISCYVTDFSNTNSLIRCVKEVMENAQYANPAYFYIHGKSTWKYRFTAEGEFYERYYHNECKFEKFILQYK